MEVRPVSGPEGRASGTSVPKCRVTLVVVPNSRNRHGVSAKLGPERVATDRRGYPIIEYEEMPLALADSARNAVAACPHLARNLVDDRQ